MIKIYHNNRCSKSRCGLEIIKESGADYEVVNYLINPPSFDELKQLINLLKITPIDLIRKNESVWKEHYKNGIYTDDQLIKIMTKNPILIERPIVINEEKAVIGRPPEIVKSIL